VVALAGIVGHDGRKGVAWGGKQSSQISTREEISGTRRRVDRNFILDATSRLCGVVPWLSNMLSAPPICCCVNPRDRVIG